MKFSLISATSMFALAAASGPARAYLLTPTPGETSLYDLVHDSDGAVAAPDPSTIAVTALQATGIGPQEASFTGPVDRLATAGTAFPLVPLGAAPGTPPDEGFATQFTGAWHWNAWQKALAIGVARIAPLIGTIGDGSSPDNKPGSSVFVAKSTPGFSTAEGSQRSAAPPGNTNTATMTVTGPASLLQRAGSGFSVAVPTGAQPLPAASEPAPAAAETPTPVYHYAPQPGPGSKGNLVAASFGDAVSASGAATFVYKPVVPAGTQPGTGPGRPNSPPTREAAAIDAQMIDVTVPIAGEANTNRADGTRTFLPASVSANPAATAARYVAKVFDAEPDGGSGQTVEVFQIGPRNGAHTTSGATASVTDPLRGKITAGVGPLDNALTLP